MVITGLSVKERLYAAENGVLVEIRLKSVEILLVDSQHSQYTYWVEKATGGDMQINYMIEDAQITEPCPRLYNENGFNIFDSTSDKKRYFKELSINVPSGCVISASHRQLITYVFDNCEVVEKSYNIKKFVSGDCQTVRPVTYEPVVAGYMTKTEALQNTKVYMVSFPSESGETKSYVHGELADVKLDPDQLQMVEEFRGFFKKFKDAGVLMAYNSDTESYMFLNKRVANVAIEHKCEVDKDGDSSVFEIEDLSSIESVYQDCKWFNSYDYTVLIEQ